MGKWTLCCRGQGRKCPEILVQDNILKIRDDDGAVVSMSLDQFNDVVATLQEAIRFRAKVRGV
jgi:hypothetical protein